MKKKTIIILLAGCFLFLTACGQTEDSEPVAEPVQEEVDTAVDTYNIDWHYFEEQMTQEDRGDFQEFMDVLNNQEKFYCFDWGDQEYSFNEYLSTIESQSEPDIEGIAVVDLDNQNGKELIINIYEGGGNYLILTRDAGKIYGTSLGARFFEELQEDGRFLGSGGAGNYYFYTMKIDSSGAQIDQYGKSESQENEDGEYVAEIEINGEIIDDSLQNWMKENYSDPVEWVEGYN